MLLLFVVCVVDFCCRARSQVRSMFRYADVQIWVSGIIVVEGKVEECYNTDAISLRSVIQYL